MSIPTFDTVALRQWDGHQNMILPLTVSTQLINDLVAAADHIDLLVARIDEFERWLRASTPVAGSDPRSAMHDPHHPFHDQRLRA